MTFEGNYLDWEDYIIPKGLTSNWYSLYGQVLFTVNITTQFLPYAGPLIAIILKKCCCKKKGGRQSFSMERKYAVLLVSLFETFTVGFGVPMLFLATGIIFAL